MDGLPAVQPDPGAPHSEWAAYAVSHGMPEAQARGLTRDQLRARFLPSGGSIGSEPDLERHDQDAAAVAARREARKPGERS
jgi:hypothetical protein